MFGHCRHRDETRFWAAGRFGGGRWGRGFGGGWGGWNWDDDNIIRAKRMLVQGDLRLLALALIAEQPRHGYEIIKLIEERTAGWYSPSPGVIYPALTYLDEVGYVRSESEGAKKLYKVTEEGLKYLEENRALADSILERLKRIGERAEEIRNLRSAWRGGTRGGSGLPRLAEAALLNLRDTVISRLQTANTPEAEERVVEILKRAAAEIQKS